MTREQLYKIKGMKHTNECASHFVTVCGDSHACDCGRDLAITILEELVTEIFAKQVDIEKLSMERTDNFAETLQRESVLTNHWMQRAREAERREASLRKAIIDYRAGILKLNPALSDALSAHLPKLEGGDSEF